MYTIGVDLPKGTPVYFRSYGTGTPVYYIIDHNLFYSHGYYCLGDDGLWTTGAVREFWKKHPHLHPHATLFDILLKKLEIGT